jgi:DNA-binding NarL/FixJ family response regulator
MRVLVADDHSLFRDGIVSLLEAAGFEVIKQVSNGLEAIEAARTHQPDVILMDISMPEMNGLEALQHIHTEFPEIQVVMLTVSDSDEDLVAAIQAGAKGYLLKNLTSEAFLNMVSGLEYGEAAMTRETTALLLDNFGKTSRVDKGSQRLTRREIELLTLVARGQSNRAIAAGLSISENTVKYHMKNILQKMNAQNRTEAATTAIRSGLIQAPSD